MPDSTFLRLRDHVALTADGNPEPLVTIGATIGVPSMVANPKTGKLEPAEVAQSVAIRPADKLTAAMRGRIVTGTRMVETADPQVTSVLLQTGNFEVCDPPTKAQAAKEAKALTDAREEAGTHIDTPEEG